MGEIDEELDMELDETELQELYSWIDQIPLSRTKKNISRDFSDAVLVAEIINHFLPKFVDLHNYPGANGNQAKMDNWNLLSRKALTRLNFKVTPSMLKGIISSKTGVIELFLHNLRHKIENFQAKRKAAALREKNQVYDELAGDMSSQSTGEHYNDNYQYSDAAFLQGQNGVGSAYPPEYNNGNMQRNPQYYPPSNNIPQAAPYYYQSEPRAIPDNRQYPPFSNETSKSFRPQKDQSPRSDPQGRVKLSDSRMPRAQSLQEGDEVQALKLALEEKEQSLLSSQETVQILQVKVRRLEHLLHLKNLRIDDLNNKLNDPQRVTPQNQLPPQNLPPGPHAPGPHAPVPPLKQHPPLPGIYPRAGDTRHHR